MEKQLPIIYDINDQWKKTLFLYDSALKQINTKLEVISNEFKMTNSYNPIEHITSRIKSLESISKKMAHNNRDLTIPNIMEYVNDIAGVRIICSFESDIYKIVEMIRKQADIKVLKVKDYIMFPKPNGYSSYHMIVSVPVYMSHAVVPTKVEIQIRTIAMDFWASLEHKIYYKFEGNAPEHIRKELKECADIAAYLDKKMMAINEEVKGYKEHLEDAQSEVDNENIVVETDVDREVNPKENTTKIFSFIKKNARGR